MDVVVFGCTGVVGCASDSVSTAYRSAGVPIFRDSLLLYEDIADWAKIAEAAKIIRDQREAGRLTGKQFYTLYDTVTEQTNSLFCGVQSSYNKLDPNGSA